MPKILGIDTSNYTTSVAVVDNDKVVYDRRQVLNVKLGEKGLRQSEALFQHIINLPVLLNVSHVKEIDGVCVSIKPRPVEGSYMPVFRAGESIAKSISSVLDVPIFETTHQEGHIEAACRSINFKNHEFIALHLSGGTSEVLRVKKKERYEIEIIGGTKDISIGQFLDRIGVAMGLSSKGSRIRIPSKVDNLQFNLSGQETLGLKYINEGYNYEEIAFSTMLCVAKTLEKVFNNIFKQFRLPVILMGGVASSQFLRNYFENKFENEILFSGGQYASDNAVGVAFIGFEKYGKL
jgi:N6-L-threonylcarbamoyladenine synthase